MNELLRALGRGDPRLIAALLVIGSIIVNVLASNLAWQVKHTKSTRGLLARVKNLAGSGGARVLYEGLRLVYYVGLPFAAMYLGWVDIRAMGLGYLDWADGLRWMIVLVLAFWSLLMFVWVPYLRATADLPGPEFARGVTWSRRIVEVIYMQAHWAFYRAACILLLANRVSDDSAIYWGTSTGLALVFIEAWADPRVRRHISQLGEGDIALWSAAQAILNAVGFILTRNVWILALLHLVMEFTVPHLRVMPPLTSEPLGRRTGQAKPKPPRAQPARVKSTKTR